MQLTHGGDWAGYEAEFGGKPLDFSANVSPLGMPEEIKAAIVAALGTADRYPDPLCRRLCAAIAEKEEVPREYCLCGNGAADLIFRVVAAAQPCRALLPAPCFAEYEQALRNVGCEVEHYCLKESEDFRLDEGILAALRPGVDMVFLCEPNNPTGLTTPGELLLKILYRCDKIGAWLIVDECFGDFLWDPEAHTLKDALAGFPNLLVLKAFTKMYAMAGVRLGYALCANTELLAAMREAGQPWAVSSLAQAAGCAALNADDYVASVRALIETERPWLIEQLQLLGLRVIEGEANYLLFFCERKLDLVKALRQKGILLRSCANYINLTDGWYRTAVRTRPENEQLIEAVREVLAEK
jgi:threonine-phosphate decarboxylase